MSQSLRAFLRATQNGRSLSSLAEFASQLGCVVRSALQRLKGRPLAPARKVAKKPKRSPRRVTRRLKPQQQERAKAADSQQTAPDQRDVAYSYALSELICERISNGESGVSVCRSPGMPTWAQLQRWRRDKPDFARRLQAAREAGCEYHADVIVDIADHSVNDYVDRLTRDGTTQRTFDREHVERSKLRIDTRKWTVSKRLRHVYGDRAEVELRTPDGINVTVEERNSLIDAICKLVHPKEDGKTKPGNRQDEPRER